MQVENLRAAMLLAILCNTVELFSRIRVFDYFAYFVRQVTKITLDALPMGAMVAFIELIGALGLWILEQIWRRGLMIFNWIS